MMLLFLFKVLCTGDPKYIPFLTLWERVEFRKVQAQIRHVIDALERRAQMDDAAWEQLIRERAGELLLPLQEHAFLVCRECGGLFLFDSANPDFYSREGIRFPERCATCSSKSGTASRRSAGSNRKLPSRRDSPI